MDDHQPKAGGFNVDVARDKGNRGGAIGAAAFTSRSLVALQFVDAAQFRASDPGAYCMMVCAGLRLTSGLR